MEPSAGGHAASAPVPPPQDQAAKPVSVEETATRWAAGPRVTVQPVGEEWPSLRLEYVSSPGKPGDERRVTRLHFGRVVQYAWGRFEFPLELGNPQDSGFHLVEITDSELIRRVVEEGAFAHLPPGRRTGASVSEQEMRHYRLGFDEHGYYDVVCADLEITHTTTTDISSYPV